MELSKYMTEFIEENVDMFDDYQYQGFFDKLCMEATYASDISSVLEFLYDDCDIDLLPYLDDLTTRPRAYEGAEYLKSINTSMKKIPVRAFAGCKNVKSVNITNCEYISENAFNNCENLEVVKIGEGMTRIVEDAFRGCKNIKRIELPSTIAEIEPRAFDCFELPDDVIVVMHKESLGKVKMRNDFAKLIMKAPKGRGRLELI